MPTILERLSKIEKRIKLLLAGSNRSSDSLGDLTSLSTTDKTSIVAAINEVDATIPSLSNYVNKTTANSYTAGAKQSFGANSINAGIRFQGIITSDPSTLVSGDFWFRSDLNKFKYYDGTMVRNFVTEQLVQALTNKDLSSLTNIFPTTLWQSSQVKAYQALGSTIVAETLTGGFNTMTTQLTMVSGTIYFSSVYLQDGETLAGVKWYHRTAFVGTSTNYNGVGLYTYLAGTLTLVASSTDDGNLWKASAGTIVGKAFNSSYVAVRGLYFIAFLWSSSATTTGPQIGSAASLSQSGVTSLDLTNSAKIVGALTGQLGLPSSIAMTGISATVNTPILALYK